MAVKWRIATEQDVHDDAERPEIAALVVAAYQMADKGVHHFGSHKLGAADWCQQLRGRDGRRVVVRIKLDTRTEIEITDLDRRQTVGIDAEDVLRLEVAVSNPLLVQKLQSLGQVAQDEACLVLRKVDTALNVRQEWTSNNLLKHQIEAVLFFEELNQLDNVRMALAVMERFYFFKNTVAAMTWHLIDNLHIK